MIDAKYNPEGYSPLEYLSKYISKYNHITIDTRDFWYQPRFSKSYNTNSLTQHAIETIEREPENYLYDTEELLTVIDRLKQETGGNCGWRYLQLKEKPRFFDTENWIKYLRIIRVSNGKWLIYNRHLKEMVLLPKHCLNARNIIFETHV